MWLWLRSMTVVTGRHDRRLTLFFHRLRSDRKYTECSQESWETVVSPKDKTALPQHKTDETRQREGPERVSAEQHSVGIQLKKPGG